MDHCPVIPHLVCVPPVCFSPGGAPAGLSEGARGKRGCKKKSHELTVVATGSISQVGFGRYPCKPSQGSSNIIGILKCHNKVSSLFNRRGAFHCDIKSRPIIDKGSQTSPQKLRRLSPSGHAIPSWLSISQYARRPHCRNRDNTWV